MRIRAPLRPQGLFCVLTPEPTPPSYEQRRLMQPKSVSTPLQTIKLSAFGNCRKASWLVPCAYLFWTEQRVSCTRLLCRQMVAGSLWVGGRAGTGKSAPVFIYSIRKLSKWSKGWRWLLGLLPVCGFRPMGNTSQWVCTGKVGWPLCAERPDKW